MDVAAEHQIEFRLEAGLYRRLICVNEPVQWVMVHCNSNIRCFQCIDSDIDGSLSENEVSSVLVVWFTRRPPGSVEASNAHSPGAVFE
jgi:hypothetical protein